MASCAPPTGGRRRHLPCPYGRSSRRPHVSDRPEVVGDEEPRDMAVDGLRSLSPALEQAVGQVQKHRRAPPDPTLAGHGRDNHHRHRSLTATHTKRSIRTRPPVLTGRAQTIRPGRARQGKGKLGQRLVDTLCCDGCFARQPLAAYKLQGFGGLGPRALRKADGSGDGSCFSSMVVQVSMYHIHSSTMARGPSRAEPRLPTSLNQDATEMLP